MSSGMNTEQAKEYAKTMTYTGAVRNVMYAKGIHYKKATKIKLRELAAIADALDISDALEIAPTTVCIERKRGENISDKGFMCSVCGFGDFNGFHGYEPNYCPNCGCDMRGVE